jgi:hypothetical protein
MPDIQRPPDPASCRLVVGMEIGPYGTGIAYRIESRGIQTSYISSWPGMPPPSCPRTITAIPRTITAILYQDWRPVAWGWEARNQYMQHLNDAQRASGRYVYLEDFQLALDKGGRSKALPTGFTPVRVIADFLRLFKTHCLQSIRDGCDSDFPDDLVQWCLTVPGTWMDDQKDAMREAAWKAGLITDKQSNQLLIILEPEAAVLYGGVSELQDLAPGTTVMVVDAGGSTVGLTVHTIQRRSGQLVLAEAAPGTAGFCGSEYVDRNFEEWFRVQVGATVFDRWKQGHYAEYLEVMWKWEEEKRRFTKELKAREVYITLPGKLLDSMDDDVIDRLEQDTGYDDRVYISSKHMREFFQPQIDEVVSLVRRLAGSCPGGEVDKMLIVGSFSHSVYFIASLKEQLGGVCASNNIVVPRSPEIVFLIGTARPAGVKLIKRMHMHVSFSVVTCVQGMHPSACTHEARARCTRSVVC